MQPVLYIRQPGGDNETTVRFSDDDPFFSEISNFIDIIEDIEEDPEAAQILSSYEGMPFSVICICYTMTHLLSPQMLSEPMNLRGPSERPARSPVQINLKQARLRLLRRGGA